MNTPSPIIVALDVDSADQARAIVRHLPPDADHFKVGIQLLTAAGPDFIRELTGEGKSVFLDLKLHEIPNSVASAIRVAGRLGVSMVSVHASAGAAVLRAAVESASAFPHLRVLALTVITSLSDADLAEIGIASTAGVQVERLARLAARERCHGVVASVLEAAALRALLPAGALVVCPGIQLPGEAATDQSRVATPAAAAIAGATHCVVGRAVVAALDPAAAFLTAQAEFRGAIG